MRHFLRWVQLFHFLGTTSAGTTFVTALLSRIRTNVTIEFNVASMAFSNNFCVHISISSSTESLENLMGPATCPFLPSNAFQTSAALLLPFGFRLECFKKSVKGEKVSLQFALRVWAWTIVFHVESLSKFVALRPLQLVKLHPCLDRKQSHHCQVRVKNLFMKFLHQVHEQCEAKLSTMEFSNRRFSLAPLDTPKVFLLV